MPISAETLSKYLLPSGILVETGTGSGEGILRALRVGFRDVRSVELCPNWHENAVWKFSGHPQVRIYHGCSEERLPEMIADITQPCTFWLDGHYAGEGTAMGPKEFPVMEELAAIRHHPVKDHTILIDDLRFLTVDRAGFGFKEMFDMLMSINPKYRIDFEDGEVESDILVARVRA